MLDDESDMVVVAQASTGEESVRECRKHWSDVVLMDVKMPRIGGLEAPRQVLQDNPVVKVIVVTAFEKEPVPPRFLEAGATGFVTKSADM